MELRPWIALTMAVIIALTGMLSIAFSPPESIPTAGAARVVQATPTVTPTVTATTTPAVYLPLIMQRWPPVPYQPDLDAIDNADQDNTYTVRWQAAELAGPYVLQEATNASFADAHTVYEGTARSWSVAGAGKTPSTYFYRVRARNEYGNGPWSSMQSVTIYPLFVGLDLRWDGTQYQRADEIVEIGIHITRAVDRLEDPDTVRIDNHVWYDPNPRDWEPEDYFTYYAILTGYREPADGESDGSNWKWGYPWVLPYDWQLQAGQTVDVFGQNFTVSGPIAGQTASGATVSYWKLVNQNRFLAWDDGGAITLHAHAGDLTLHYDAGGSRLSLHSDLLFRLYYNGAETPYNTQEIDDLTSANAFPGAGVLSGGVDYRRRPSLPSPNWLEGVALPQEMPLDFHGFARRDDVWFH